MSDHFAETYDQTRRRFLQAAAGAGLASIAGVGAAQAAGSYAADYAVDPKVVYDVILVGAGTAGIPLAIFAAQRGGKVLVIEKSGQIGGTLFMSGGMMSAAGTRLQARKGINDNPDLFYADVMRLAHNKANPAVLRPYVDNAGATLDWLESIGLTFPEAHPLMGTAHANFSVARYVSGPRGGRSLIDVMVPQFIKAEAAGNLRVLMRTGAEELIQGRNGAVGGVVAQDERGVRTRYMGRNIVLASGGCMMNPVLFEKITGKPLYGRRSYAPNMGKGIELGLAAGGKVSGGDHFIGHRGVILQDRSYPSPQFTNIAASVDPRYRAPWEIEVNTAGRRYIAEDADLDTLERAQTDQPGMAAWLVWDQEIYDKAPPLFKTLTKEQQAAAFEVSPMFAKAASIEELARKMDVPVAALVQTVRAYNDSVAGKPDALGRKHMPLPVAKGPFYAVQCLGSAIFGHAGLDVDGGMRVLDKAGRPIPNLYAAGEIIGGWHTHGDVVVNGGSVTPAITFGRLLGQTLKFA